MSVKFVRYTCAKKKHPVLRKDCEKCPEYRPCAEDGKWCFVGALLEENEPISESVVQSAAMSTLDRITKDTATITIFFGNGKYENAQVSREDFKAALKKEIQKGLGDQFFK